MRLSVVCVVLSCSSPDPAPRPRSADPDPEPAPDPVSVPVPVAVAVADTGPSIPIENRERRSPPGPSSAEAGARRLLEAIKADDPARVLDFFFPADAFDLVKAMAVPGRYHRRLVAWYEEDVRTEHDRYADVASLAFDRFEMGRCAWMEVGTEGNALPYWSCRRSLLWARAGERERRFEIRVLINWGPRWYVTHLGPIRRS